MTRRRRFSLLLSSAVLVSGMARATAVGIDPVRVLLSEHAHSQSLTLRNGGSEKARFQLRVYTWQQSPSGEMQLGATGDLVYYPSLLEVAPGETRRIRVAADVEAGKVEKSYRLFIEELPPDSAGPAAGVRVLTRLGVPVFIQPGHPEPKPTLSAKLSRQGLAIEMSNVGNAYFLSDMLRVIGRDASGKAVLQQELPGWYVLAGGRRHYELPLSAGECAKLARISVSARTSHGPVQAELVPAPGACASE